MLLKKFLAIFIWIWGLIWFSYANSAYYDRAPFLDQKVINLSEENKYWFYPKFYIIQSSDNNLKIKDYNWIEALNISWIKLDGSIPFFVNSKNFLIVQKVVSNPNEYIKLNDWTKNTYNKFLYITNWAFYDAKNIKKVKIWVSKDIDYVAFLSDKTLEVLYTDWTAEYFSINYLNWTVNRTAIEPDIILNKKLISLKDNGVISVFYSLSDKTLYINKDGSFIIAKNLPEFNLSDLNNVSILNFYDSNLGKSVDRISVIINWKKYLSAINDISNFSEANSSTTYNIGDVISYNKNINSIIYNAYDPLNWLKKKFNFYIPLNKRIEDCWKFDFITETNQLLVKFDRCLFLYNNLEHTDSIVDNIMIPFYVDYYKKLPELFALSKSKWSIKVSSTGKRTIDNNNKEITLPYFAETWYTFHQSKPNNVNISYISPNGIQFDRLNDNNNHYTTIWFKDSYLSSVNNLEITYDVKFINGAKWGGISIGNIFLDVNPARIGFRWPEVYTNWLEKNTLYHIKIIFKRIENNKYNVKIYVNWKLINEYTYDETNYNIEDFIKQYGIWLRSNYYQWSVIYSNIKFWYLDVAKDKEVFELLRLPDYYKFRTRLNTIDEANQYITKLLTAYKRAYLLVNDISTQDKKIDVLGIENDIKNILTWFNTDYKSIINSINQEIVKTKQEIDQTKLNIFQNLPLTFENILYSFKEKATLDFTQTIDNIKFIEKAEDSNKLSKFDDTTQKLIQKKEGYKYNLINKTYQKERIVNTNNLILNIANLFKFIGDLDDTFNGKLYIDGKVYDVPTLKTQLAKMFNKLYDSSFDSNWNAIGSLIFFNSDYDINRYLIPDILANYNYDREYLDLQWIWDRLSTDSTRNYIFDLQKIYNAIKNLTREDIINKIGQYSKMYIHSYKYDNHIISNISMKDFISNFNDPEKSVLYKDDNGDWQNDYILEDVLLDIFTKLTDDIDDSSQNINVVIYDWSDLAMFYILKFKRDLADSGITFSDYFSKLKDIQNYDPVTLDQSIKNSWINIKHVINYLYNKVPEQTWVNDISKLNILLNNVDYFIKGIEVPYIDNLNWRLLKLTNIDELEWIDLNTLFQLELKSEDYYTLNNIKWDSFYDPIYLQYYKNNWLTRNIDLIDKYYNLLNKLAVEQQQLQNAYQFYADSLNSRLNLFKNILDISKYSFEWNETSINDNTIISVVNSLQKDYIIKVNNEIQSKVNWLGISEQKNINSFGWLLYLLDPIRYQPTALTYKDSNILSDEYSNYLIQQWIIDKITIDNISQYETYDIPTPQLFNEYYSVLKEILTLKQKLFKGDASYDDIVNSINKISDYKKSKSREDLNAYITYVKNIVKKYYYDSIIDLYNVLKALEYNEQDFKFVLSDYLNNSTELISKINDENFDIDWTQTVWNSANIVYDPANNIYNNSIYNNLMELINTKVSEIDPYINYNIAKLQLDNLWNQVNDFKEKFDKDLSFNDLNSAYKLLKGQINAINLSDITVDTTDLQNKKNKLLSELDDTYQTKIKRIKNNISDYLKKYFDSKVYLIYTAKNIEDLDYIYNWIMQELSKITGKNETDKQNYKVKQDICPINDSENWLGLKTESWICGSIISNWWLDTTYIKDLKQRLLQAKKQKMQYLSNNIYSEYFSQLLSYKANALDEIFDWSTNSLKTDNPKLEIVPVTTNAGDFRTKKCQYIIYDKTIFLGLICNGHLPKIDKPDDSDTEFNKIALYFTDTVSRNYYYNLISHYNTIQDETQSHYKSVFLILDDTKNNKVLYLKSYFIPNQTNIISIRNNVTTYMSKTFDKPFLTKTGVEEVTSSVINDIDILSKNWININDIKDDSLLFNDKKLTAYLVNNISYIIDKIKLIENLVDKATVDSIYNILSDKLVNIIWLEELDNKNKILNANMEKEIIFNTLNQINNLTFNTYETQVSLIKNQLNKITYFTDAKDYLTNLMQSKVNSFNEFKDSLLFQKKLNKVDEMLGEFNEHIADTTLDEIDELFNKVKNYINNNFWNQNIISSLMDKLNAKYNEVKTAIENNIAYSSSYIDANSEIEWRTEANNILTNTFDNKFVEQLSFNNILKDTWIVRIINNQYVVDNAQLKSIKTKFEDKLWDNSNIDVKNILNVTDLKANITDTGILQNKTLTSIKQKLVPFIYITLKNGKYNVPIDVTNISTNDTGFFEGVDPRTNTTSIKSLEYKTIKWQVLDANWNVIGNKDIEGNVTIFMPSKNISLQLKPDTKFLVEIKNLSDKQNVVEFYQKEPDWKLTPVIMNDFVVQDNVAKIRKNYSNNIQGIKTWTLNVSR